ncbi:hypothetical protein [Streptomyces sp. NPDC090022]|uniref:hypothetical protein n=1 Tax=Streptomyces sp. NPDC090022 TaxID=3365920 RepID=UPI003803AE43
MLRRVARTPLDSTAWYLLFADCPADEIGRAVAAAERLLPLDGLLADPEPGIAYGEEYEADRILDTIVCRLGAIPATGSGCCGRRCPRAAPATAGWRRTP